MNRDVAERLGTHGGELPDLRAVVGWKHLTFPGGIDLQVQRSRSAAALQQQDIDTCHLVMTRNQALLLARYLLEVTGQQLPEPPRSLWARIRKAIRHFSG